MGQYADYVINGDDCQYCGEYLGEGDGYARACRSCADDEIKEDRKQRAEEDKKRAAAKIKAGHVAAKVMALLEKEYSAPFIPAIAEEMIPQLAGIIRGIELLGTQLTHTGLAKSVREKQHDQARAAERRQKRSSKA